MRCQDGINVSLQAFLFELDPHSVADFGDGLCWEGTLPTIMMGGEIRNERRVDGEVREAHPTVVKNRFILSTSSTWSTNALAFLRNTSLLC
jgi:hypothetical protein